MSAATTDTEILDVMELLLTAEILNKNPDLTIDDLTPKCRDFFRLNGNGKEIRRPVLISEGAMKRDLDISDAYSRLKKNPFVSYEEFGQRLSITALEPAALWFLKRGGNIRVEKNPVLAYYFEKMGLSPVSYHGARLQNPLYEDTKAALEEKISTLIGNNEEMKSALDLIIISAPEEIEFSLDALVCTPRQEEALKKIEIALENRVFLREHGVYEFGKLLFVGPPGTGKTSFALALGPVLHMPILEVRLAMITSQYLGETSKNIDRIFELARKLAPCILFIDEFDYVAKSRITDDNGAMKRAVNMLLKNIDAVSFIKNGVLLIGATNHPTLLDEAAWRRFDEVLEFPLPEFGMRLDILKKITSNLDCSCDFDKLAERTEGFSGADLRIMIKEALLFALMKGSRSIQEEDIEKGMDIVTKRDKIRQNVW
jgi:SpoVK/Ycf46/Vps4 family AAA+-type ATPase